MSVGPNNQFLALVQVDLPTLLFFLIHFKVNALSHVFIDLSYHHFQFHHRYFPTYISAGL